jgi:hypothetical protein
VSHPRSPHRIAAGIVCLGSCLVATGCGVSRANAHATRIATTAAPTFNAPGLPCAVQTFTLLTPDEIPVRLTPEFPPNSRAGGPGLLDNGDAAYPGYVGDAAAYFAWTGLLSGAPAAMVASAYATTGNQAPLQLGDLPQGGPLYTTYPDQVFQVAEATSDFGSVVTAERWMTAQRMDHPTEDVANYGSGVERSSTLASMGDDAFIYQIDMDAPNVSTPYSGAYIGHSYTDVEVRAGDVIFAVSVDSGPDIDSSSFATSVVSHLMAKEESACGS